MRALAAAQANPTIDPMVWAALALAFLAIALAFYIWFTAREDRQERDRRSEEAARRRVHERQE